MVRQAGCSGGAACLTREAWARRRWSPLASEQQTKAGAPLQGAAERGHRGYGFGGRRVRSARRVRRWSTRPSWVQWRGGRSFRS
jgi:hypothetical protein